MVYLGHVIHYGHNNISNKHTSRWDEGYRDFKSLEDMNEILVKNINKLVKEDDILYHLGDFVMGGIQNIWNFRKQLSCKNIHLILGNHDSHIKDNKLINKEHDDLNPYTCHDLFTSVQDVLIVKHGKHEFFLSHYPHLSWYHASRGVIMLHGHEHGQLDHLNKAVRRLDVGVDAAKNLLGEYRPFSIEEVISIVDKKASLMIGHHKGQF